MKARENDAELMDEKEHCVPLSSWLPTPRILQTK